MDPLSVTASITGIIVVATKLCDGITTLIKKERNAPPSMSALRHEVSDLSVCLVQIQPFIQNDQSTPRSRRAAITVELVIVITTSCVVNLAKLEEILDSFRIDQPLATFDRMRWIKREPEINELMARVQASKVSLILILIIFKWCVYFKLPKAIPFSTQPLALSPSRRTI